MLPGGFVEIGESSSEALRREFREELGVAGAIGPIIWSAAENYTFLNLVPEQVPLLVIVHDVTLSHGELKPSDDVVEAVWFGVRDVPRRIAFFWQRNFLSRFRSARQTSPKRG